MRLLSLFSGIGAFEKALENLGVNYELVGFSEVDKYAIQSYCAIHDINENLNLGDVSKIENDKLPAADLITYGFPCQDISIAGLQKGIKEGTRSGLLYEAERIIKHVKPKYAIAENVKNLVGKKHKNDFDELLKRLDEYGYNNYWEVLNAKDFGIPQNRERVFIVSIRKDIDSGKFEFPKPYDGGLRLKDLLEDEVEEKYYIDNERANELIERLKDDKKGSYPNVEDGPKVTSALSSREHRGSGWNDVVGTLCARDYKDPKVIAEPTVCEQRTDEGLRFFKGGVVGTLRTIDSCGDKRVLKPNELKLHTKEHDYKIRKLTPLECWRLMGFTDNDYWAARTRLEETFYNGGDRSNSQMYKQAGNSICVNVLEAIFKELVRGVKC